MIYIIYFFISAGLFYVSRNRERKIRVIIDFIAILIPCVLAGIRANTVGTDVSVYLEPMVNNVYDAHNFQEYLLSSWQQGWVTRGVADIELGFSFLVYSVIKIFDSIYVLQFVIQLLTICPIYIGLREKNDENLWIGMLVYYCMFYNISLNIMRQAIAIAFLFLAFQYLFNEKKKKFLFSLIIACLFHNSAILGFFIWIIYEFIRMKIFVKSKMFRSTNSRLFILIGIGVIVLFSQNFIVSVMNMVGLDAYVHYVSGDMSFLPNQLFIRIPVLILCYIFREKLYQKEETIFAFYVCCVIYTIIFSQFASVNSFAYRIAMQFSVFQIGLIPDIATVPTRVRFGSLSRIRIGKLIMIAYLFVWWSYYCLVVTDSTLPYDTPFF